MTRYNYWLCAFFVLCTTSLSSAPLEADAIVQISTSESRDEKSLTETTIQLIDGRVIVTRYDMKSNYVTHRGQLSAADRQVLCELVIKEFSSFEADGISAVVNSGTHPKLVVRTKSRLREIEYVGASRFRDVDSDRIKRLCALIARNVSPEQPDQPPSAVTKP